VFKQDLMTRIQLQEGVWLVRILAVGSTMDDTIHSPTSGVADRNERWCHSRFSPEGPISPYAVLGAMASSGNWSGGGEHSHLVFSRRREGEAKARGGSSLLARHPSMTMALRCTSDQKEGRGGTMELGWSSLTQRWSSGGLALPWRHQRQQR
jgi:hypothetical protein